MGDSTGEQVERADAFNLCLNFSRTRGASFDDYACAAYSVLPLHTECGHLQSTSAVSSIVSHCGLQYFSEVTWHVQTGCAHFLLSLAAMSFFLSPTEGPSLACNGPRIHT
jgi:hypothetical protein